MVMELESLNLVAGQPRLVHMYGYGSGRVQEGGQDVLKGYIITG